MSKLLDILKQNSPDFYRFVISRHPRLIGKTTKIVDNSKDIVEDDFIQGLEEDKREQELTPEDVPF